MKNEISNILKLISDGNTTKGLENAIELYNQNQNSLSAVKVLVYAYIQVGNFEKVIALLDQKFRNLPAHQDFDYFNNMGYAKTQIEEFESALLFLEKAHDINPAHPGPPTNLATAFQKMRIFDRAKFFIDKAMDAVFALGENAYSYYSGVFLLQSEIYSALNLENNLIKTYTNLIKKKFNENIFYLLTTIDTDNLDNDLIDQAIKKLDRPANQFANNIQRFNFFTPLYFGLANYYAKIDQKNSEYFFVKGNNEIFQSSRYNSFEYQKNILKSIDLFKTKYLDYNDEDSPNGKENFFIVGAPRSGTTLIESIITANKDVFPGGELNSFKFLIEKHIRINSQSIDEFRAEIISKYLKRTNFLRKNFRFIVDKLPENFLYIGFLTKLLPQAKIIRVVRNPWDIAISLFKQRYVINVPYSSSFFNIGVFLANFEAINRFWDHQSTTQQNILTIRYEDLVSNKKEYQKQLYSFLEINSEYIEEKRQSFASPTDHNKKIRKEINQGSIKKTGFESKKEEFYDALNSQRQYWINKGYLSKNDDFYGYLDKI